MIDGAVSAASMRKPGTSEEALPPIGSDPALTCVGQQRVSFELVSSHYKQRSFWNTGCFALPDSVNSFKFLLVAALTGSMQLSSV